MIANVQHCMYQVYNEMFPKGMTCTLVKQVIILSECQIITGIEI